MRPSRQLRERRVEIVAQGEDAREAADLEDLAHRRAERAQHQPAAIDRARLLAGDERAAQARAADVRELREVDHHAAGTVVGHGRPGLLEGARSGAVESAGGPDDVDVAAFFRLNHHACLPDTPSRPPKRETRRRGPAGRGWIRFAILSPGASLAPAWG